MNDQQPRFEDDETTHGRGGDATPPPAPPPRRNDEAGDIPASVTFMEMMRQAAAKNAPPPGSPAYIFRRKPAEPETLTPPPAPPTLPQEEKRTTGEFVGFIATNALPDEQPPESQSQDLIDLPLAPATPPPDLQQAALEAQRIQRVKKRQAKRRQRAVGVFGAVVRSLMVVVIASILMATIYTWMTPSDFIAERVRAELSQAQAVGLPTAAPTAVATPNWLRKIGIVSGHRGPQVPPDPGAVCPDGRTEADVNFAVAQLVVRNLRARGYSVELLDEFDPRLDGYQAAALISIHANTCKDFGEPVSGFLIARAAARTLAGNDDILVDCTAQYYARTTGLPRREGVTVDMTDYHSFREIHPLTPAAIIELGFMLADKEVLTNKHEEMAQGITDGILCFLEPYSPPPTPPLSADVSSVTATP